MSTLEFPRNFPIWNYFENPKITQLRNTRTLYMYPGSCITLNFFCLNFGTNTLTHIQPRKFQLRSSPSAVVFLWTSSMFVVRDSAKLMWKSLVYSVFQARIYTVESVFQNRKKNCMYILCTCVFAVYRRNEIFV